MNKEAILVLLDVGPSMWKTPVSYKPNPSSNVDAQLDLLSGTNSYLEQAVVAVRRLIQQKIIDSRKSDLFGLILFGTDDAEDHLSENSDEHSHIFIAHDFEPAKVSLLKWIQESLPLGNSICDPVEALAVGVERLLNVTANKKYIRKIFLLTDAGSSVINMDGADSVIERIRSMDITLDIIGLDFDDQDNPDGFKQKNKPEQKQKNEAILSNIAHQANGNVFTIHEAISLLSHFSVKRTRPSILFRGNLTLGIDPNTLMEEKHETAMALPVHLYSKTHKLALPTAKKVPRQHGTLPEGNIERLVSYFSVPNENRIIESDDPLFEGTEEIFSDRKIKAYRYGNVLVPFQESDEQILRLNTVRSLSIIGFVPAARIPRQSIMGPVYTMVLDEDRVRENESILFSSLLHAMYEKDCFALVRYVRTNGSSPKICILNPMIKKKYEVGYLSVIPFSEDIRQYTFAPLDICKRFQVLGKPLPSSLSDILRNSKLQNDIDQKMDHWIDSLDLMEIDPNDTEAYKPSMTFNPSFQLLYDCVEHRLIYPHAEELPHINPMLRLQTEPKQHLLNSSRYLLDDLLETLPLLCDSSTQPDIAEAEKSVKQLFPFKEMST